jgi:hypothetical protein
VPSRVTRIKPRETRLRPTGKLPKGASGGARRRRANGRKECEVACALRFGAGLGSNRAARGQHDLGRNRLSENATREVLEHLTLEAVVIGRVGRAAGDAGDIETIIRFRTVDVVRNVVMMMRRSGERDPR